jgi:hypothetical protein
MAQRLFTFSPPSNPLLQVVYILIGGLLLIGAIVMGAVVLAIGLGLAVILGIAVYLRVLWLNRKLRRSARQASTSTAKGDLLEVEYSVVDERDPGEPRDAGARGGPQEPAGREFRGPAGRDEREPRG